MTDKRETSNSRILYVDPADAFTAKNSDGSNTLITPPYEDMCISFDLVVENYPRRKATIATIGVGDDAVEVSRKVISWYSKNNRASMMAGNNFGQGDDKPTYLTTYYADISHNNYGAQDFSDSQQIVEGLGVENVTINFESWICPAVTIKFVDVRGSALFGNEEALHSSDGKITAENIFGSFMTLPFPRFRLQVKGFLGNPVTLQLTCSGFSGEFNADNGNFEVTVKFIGYMYALLTDIPFEYLVLAPSCTYEGMSYWNRKRTEPSWALSNGEQPPTLLSIESKIRGIHNSTQENSTTNTSLTEHDNDIIREADKEREMLKAIQSEFKTFKDKFLYSEVRHAYCNEVDGKMQYVLFSPNSKVRPTEGSSTAYMSFLRAVNTYNEAYPSRSFTQDDLPNKWARTFPSELTFMPLLNITKDDDGQTSMVLLYKDKEGTRAVESDLELALLRSEFTCVFKDGIKRVLNRPNAKVLYDRIKSNSYLQLEENWYILDANTIECAIKTRLKDLETEKLAAKKRVEDSFNLEIINELGFKPSIYNVFKIMMCHLETFVHMYMKLANDILYQTNSGERNASSLNVNISETDIVPSFDKHGRAIVPPWPLVVKNSMDDSGKNIIEWIGDRSRNFLEEDMVTGLCNAITKRNEILSPYRTGDTYEYIPLLLNDFVTPPYQYLIEETDFGVIAGHIVTRAMQLISLRYRGMLNNDTLKGLGTLDAYNFCRVAKTPAELSTNIFKRLGNMPFATAVKGIAECSSICKMFETTNPSGTGGHYNFEVRRRTEKNGRDPIISQVGEHYEYDRWTYEVEGKAIQFMPTDIKCFKKYLGENFQVEDGKPLVQTNTRDFACEWITPVNTVTYANRIWDDTEINLINRSQWRIITDNQQIASLERLSEKMSDQCELSACGVKLDYEPSAELADVVLGDFKHYNEFYEGSSLLVPTSLMSDVVRNKLKLPTADSVSGAEAGKKYEYDANAFKFNSQCKNGKWYYDNEEYEIGDLSPLCLNIWTANGQGGFTKGSLFGHSFYYTTPRVDGETDEDVVQRKNRRRALLFLLSLGFKPVKLNCFTGNGNVNETCPYAYLLLLGGLLWRSNIIDKGEIDPILGTDYNNICDDGYHRICVKKLTNGYCLCVHPKSTANFSPCTFLTVAEYFGRESKEYWQPDMALENELLGLFDDFVENDWPTIAREYELLNAKCCYIAEDDKVREYEDDDFTTDWEYIRKALCKYENGKWSFKKTNTVKWVFDELNLYFNNWRKKYSVFVPVPTIEGSMFMVFDESNAMLNKIKELFLRKALISSSVRKSMFYRTNTEITDEEKICVSVNDLDTYLTSFGDTLRKFADKYEDLSGNTTTVNTNDNDDALNNKDVKLSIYLSLKNIWDKWLLSAKENEYDVDEFFEKNFVFMDSFYLNIRDKLPINMDIFYELMTATPRNKTLYNMIDEIVNKHNCMFLAVPDYVGFTGDSAHDYDEVKRLFSPVPYNSKDPLRDNNKFVIVYTYGGSNMIPGDKEYSFDSFDIWNKETGVDVAPDVFKVTDENIGSMSKYGYNIPSFGVAFASQYNHVFKNIRVNMNNPVLTESAIKIIEQTMEVGREGNRKFTYCGQDLYPVYSNYAYECEIEMLGNAQIAPLMYFQLLNVPMWHGTYMVYNVSHTMTPGNMTTRIKGTRMSNRCVPFVRDLHSFLGDNINNDAISDNTVSNNNENYDGATLQPSYSASGEEIKPYYKESIYNNASIPDGVNPTLETLFNTLVDEIKNLNENKGVNQGKGKWSIRCTSAVRKDNEKSAHYSGNAIDIHITRFNSSGQVSEYCQNDTLQPELFTVLDILHKNHQDVVGRVLIEYGEQSTMYRGDVTKLRMLHIESQSETSPCRMSFTPWIMSQENGSYGSINKNDSASDNRVDCPFLSNLPSTFKSIAAAEYDRNPIGFSTRFPNFAYYDNDVIREYFGNKQTNSSNAFEKWYTWSMSWEGDYGGATKAAYAQYRQDGGQSANPTVKEIAHLIGWEKNHLEQIRDDSVAIACMWVIYWTGNANLILRALRDRNYSSNLKQWRLNTSLIQEINNQNGSELFSAIKEMAARFMFDDTVNNVATPTSSDKNKIRIGWIRRWHSINYNTQLKKNDNSVPRMEIDDFKNEMQGLYGGSW